MPEESLGRKIEKERSLQLVCLPCLIQTLLGNLTAPCTERIPGGTDGLFKGHLISAVLMASE